MLNIISQSTSSFQNRKTIYVIGLVSSIVYSLLSNSLMAQENCQKIIDELPIELQLLYNESLRTELEFSNANLGNKDNDTLRKLANQCMKLVDTFMDKAIELKMEGDDRVIFLYDILRSSVCFPNEFTRE